MVHPVAQFIGLKVALLDAKFVPLALKLLTKYGATAQIRMRNTNYSFSASTGTRESAADETVTVYAVPPSMGKDLIRDGSNEGSAVTYVSPLELVQAGVDVQQITVKNCDTFIMPNEKDQKIIKIVKIYSGDEIALIRLDLE